MLLEFVDLFGEYSHLDPSTVEFTFRRFEIGNGASVFALCDTAACGKDSATQ
jgi:hypothetical protein